jgi:hypothetical protein
VQTYRGQNPQTLFLLFWSTKNILNSSPNASNIAKISQFDKRVGKIWGVWCKGGSVFGDKWMKTNYEFELKIFDSCIFISGIQRSFVKPYLMHSSSFKSLNMDSKWERYEGETRKRSKAIFSKKLKQTITQTFPRVFCVTPLLLKLKNTFVTLQFLHPMTKFFVQFG